MTNACECKLCNDTGYIERDCSRGGNIEIQSHPCFSKVCTLKRLKADRIKNPSEYPRVLMVVSGISFILLFGILIFLALLEVWF